MFFVSDEYSQSEISNENEVGFHILSRNLKLKNKNIILARYTNKSGSSTLLLSGLHNVNILILNFVSFVYHQPITYQRLG